MHIAQINNNLQPTNRESCGSIGAHVGVLSDELYAMDHDVTVYGAPGTQTEAPYIIAPPPMLNIGGDGIDEAVSRVLDVAKPLAVRGTYDVIHSHIEPHAYSLGKLQELGNYALTCAVLHKDPPPQTIRQIQRFSVPFVAFSRAQANRLDVPWLGVVHHGVDTDFLCPQDTDSEPQDTALIISRIVRKKGIHTAIQASLEAGLRVDIAGPIGDASYFASEVAPLLQGPRARYIGVLKGERKRRAYAEAAVTVTASKLPETFCLVLAESMACKTPAVALRYGACPEVIDDGVSGYTVDSSEDLVEAIQKAVTLDRELVRATATERFSAPRMATEYGRLYQKHL